MIAFSNPRIEATFTDWPLGGSKRGACRFWVEYDKKRGYRFGRQTTGKPKFMTYGGQACIVDGSDGRTYLIQKAGIYDFITISSSDFMNADPKRIGHDASVFEKNSPELHAELLRLIVSGGSLSLTLQPEAAK